MVFIIWFIVIQITFSLILSTIEGLSVIMQLLAAFQKVQKSLWIADADLVSIYCHICHRFQKQDFKTKTKKKS